MGKEGQYDLKLADCVSSSIISPDTETEDETSLTEMHLSGGSHPTKLLKNASMKMLKMISVSIALYGDQIEKCALANVSSMFRTLLASKSRLSNMGLQYWTTLGFLRAIAQPKQMSKLLTTPTWLNLCIDILNSPITDEMDVYKKLHCVRLLHATLIHWDMESERELIEKFIEQLFECLGRIVLFCPNDLSILHASVDVKSRVLLSASNSSTVAEEMVSLLRKLHTLPTWNNAISSYLSQKLCIAAEFFTESTDDAHGRQSIIRHSSAESEKAYVLAALVTIGGCDPRPRIGIHIANSINDGTITAFTTKGKVVISSTMSDSTIFSEKKKISISTAASCAITTPFNMNRLPLNEMLLNSLTVLLYGPGEWKPYLKTNVDVNLLRMQQVHLSTLNSMGVLFKNQSSLRKILRQRVPGVSRYSSEESLSEQEVNVDIVEPPSKVEISCDDKNTTPEPTRHHMGLNVSQTSNQTDHHINDDDLDDFKTRATNELLLQNILARAIQSNPLKSIYSYEELSLAALNLSQQLANDLYMENSVPYFSAVAGTSKMAKPTTLPPLQPTLIHGVPFYHHNDTVSKTHTDSYIKTKNF